VRWLSVARLAGRPGRRGWRIAAVAADASDGDGFDAASRLFYPDRRTRTVGVGGNGRSRARVIDHSGASAEGGGSDGIEPRDGSVGQPGRRAAGDVPDGSV